MKKARSQIYLALGMVLLSGCATRFAVDVSGFANREKLLPVQATYVLLPVQGKENDLAFQEYAGMVGKKLDARGYKRTDIKSADLAIFLITLTACQPMAQPHFRVPVSEAKASHSFLEVAQALSGPKQWLAVMRSTPGS
jgi:hypothetical protein